MHRTSWSLSLSLPLSLFLPLAACVAADDVGAPALGADDQAIVDGLPALPWMVQRAVAPINCTATLIAQRFVLTALHCLSDEVAVGRPVQFYADASGPDRSTADPIVAVRVPSGTAPPFFNIDLDGRFADLAILELRDPAPTSVRPYARYATLAWRYPGDDAFVVKVGAGAHDGELALRGELRWQIDRTSAHDTPEVGQIWTNLAQTDGNDSGGPLYTDDQRLLCVLFGHDDDEAHNPAHNLYTSVPRHLDWILRTIGWTWPGGPPQAVQRFGAVRERFVNTTERVCQYACRHDVGVAYTFGGPRHECVILDSVTSYVQGNGYHSAILDP